MSARNAGRRSQHRQRCSSSLNDSAVFDAAFELMSRAVVRAEAIVEPTHGRYARNPNSDRQRMLRSPLWLIRNDCY